MSFFFLIFLRVQESNTTLTPTTGACATKKQSVWHCSPVYNLRSACVKGPAAWSVHSFDLYYKYKHYTESAVSSSLKDSQASLKTRVHCFQFLFYFISSLHNIICLPDLNNFQKLNFLHQPDPTRISYTRLKHIRSK